MKTLRANIPSTREFTVNENGEIFNYLGKPLKGKGNPASKTLRSIDFVNLEGKRQTMSIQKIVWNTFHSDNPVGAKEIIMLIDQNHPYPFAVSNLKKVSQFDNVKVINKIRLDKVNEKRNNNSK